MTGSGKTFLELASACALVDKQEAVIGDLTGKKSNCLNNVDLSLLDGGGISEELTGISYKEFDRTVRNLQEDLLTMEPQAYLPLHVPTKLKRYTSIEKTFFQGIKLLP